ncbi:UNVERIFIED_CONTAM: Nuclear intron maturase 4, mitochondrial [Sesamum angustifolium]|uniref:Nuclear intron maturase 4, mitochondrial n=1 Tax=Sesamum angustifolium TaxID=2727405 RepID=A0AAW2MTZ6_9LAMI
MDGYARTCYVLILLDDNQIIDWFTGIVHRWLKWYSECNNFSQVKHIISNQVRMSCIRTLAAKYRIHEAEIEKKFDPELSRILSTQEIELEEANTELIPQEATFDGALMYGINYSGLCLLSLARMVSQSRPCNCLSSGAQLPSYVFIHFMQWKDKGFQLGRQDFRALYIPAYIGGE